MTTLCEMDVLNFLLLIWVHYLPLPPTQKDRPPRPPQLPPGWGPNLGALHKTKLAPQIAIFLKLASQLGFDPKFNKSQIQNLLTRSRSKNWTLEVKKIQNLIKWPFFIIELFVTAFWIFWTLRSNRSKKSKMPLQENFNNEKWSFYHNLSSPN